MKRKIFAASMTAAVVMFLVGPVGAQGHAPAPSQPASTKGPLGNAQTGARPGQATGMSPAKSSNVAPASKSAAGRTPDTPIRDNPQTDPEIARQLRGVSARVDAISNNIASVSAVLTDKLESVNAKLSELQPKPDPRTPPRPSSVPAWIAAGIGLLAACVMCLAFPVLLGIKRQINGIGDRVQKNAADAQEIGTSINNVQASVADLPKALQFQLKQLVDAVQKIDGKVGKFERTVSDIPRQFDAVSKTMSRDAESSRGTILSWLFGRGKAQAPENGFTQQIEEQIEKFQAAVLSAVESEQKLQSRKHELDDRERRLNERANKIDVECVRARDEGAAAAGLRAASLEAANKVLAENMNSKAVEFGKRIEQLEGEMNAAKAAAQQAKSDCAMSKSQADAAVKQRERLSAEVSRLSSEIAKRDQAREIEIANAREEIKSTIERANAEGIANLRAEAKIARDERDGAKRTAEALQAQKTAVDAALAAATSSLEKEKAARENDRIAAERELAAEKAARKSDLQKAEEMLTKIAQERDLAVSRVFPAEFQGDPDFQPLLSMLDGWDANNVPGSALARASLSIFADRKNLPPKIWQRALGDLSLGLARAMNAERKSPAEAADVLGKWKMAVQKRVSDGPSFSLNLPSVGAQVDTSWMHAKPGAAKVSRIGSWAVYGQSGNVYMAEVE